MTILLSKLRFSIYVLALIFTSVLTGQTDFKNGYFIDNSNTKIECLIKDLDWKNYPTEFSYKLNESADIQVRNLQTTSKFEIYDSAIFVRSEVEVDLNSTSSNKLTSFPELELTTKTVFLKLLVDGKASLYVYKDANSKRYYFQTETSDTSLLEYKEYVNDNNQIAKNQTYKRQLWDALQCTSMEMNMVNNTDYKESDLIELFVTYNTCMDDLKYTFKDKKGDNVIHLSLRPGINYNKANLDTPGSNIVILRDFDFDNELSFRFGVELEYILPFNNDKWSLIFEPTYQYYKTDKTFNSSPGSPIERQVTATVDYSSIEIPIGFRHYSYLNANSRLFFNFLAMLDISFKSEIEYMNTFYESDTGSNIAFGLGYSYQNKYSIEARIHTKREILNEYATVSSEYSNISFIFGYTLF